MSTTIRINTKTKSELDRLKEYESETYDEIIRKVIFIAKNIEEDTELSKKALREIERSRERMKKGYYLTEEEVKKRLGL